MKEEMIRYSGKSTRITHFTCKRCGEESKRFKSIEFNKIKFKYSDGIKCTNCSSYLAKRKKLHKGRLDFFKAIRRKFPEVDYSKAFKEYVGSGVKVTIICPIHGEYLVRPSDHLKNTFQCIRCENEHRSTVTKKYSLEDYRKALPSGYTLVGTEYGYMRTMMVNCSIHGNVKSTGKAIITGRSVCKKCNSFKHQKESIRQHLIGTIATVYYVYITAIDMYKVGVTTDKASRYKVLGDLEVILEYELDYITGIEFEHKICNVLEEFRYKGTKTLVKNGNTELFKTNVEQKIRDLHKGFIEVTLCLKLPKTGNSKQVML